MLKYLLLLPQLGMVEAREIKSQLPSLATKQLFETRVSYMSSCLKKKTKRTEERTESRERKVEKRKEKKSLNSEQVKRLPYEHKDLSSDTEHLWKSRVW